MNPKTMLTLEKLRDYASTNAEQNFNVNSAST